MGVTQKTKAKEKKNQKNSSTLEYFVSHIILCLSLLHVVFATRAK